MEVKYRQGCTMNPDIGEFCIQWVRLYSAGDSKSSAELGSVNIINKIIFSAGLRIQASVLTLWVAALKW